MSAESGKFGDLKIGASSVFEILKIRWKEGAVVTQYGSNMGAGFKKAISGTLFGEGSLEGKYDFALLNPLKTNLKNGTTVTLLIYANAGTNWSVPAKIENWETQVDIDDGTPVSWTADFKTDGAWVEETPTP